MKLLNDKQSDSLSQKMLKSDILTFKCNKSIDIF